MPEPMLRVEITPPIRDLQGRYAKAEPTLVKLQRENLRVVGRKVVVIAKEEAPKGKTRKFSQGIQFKTYQRSAGGQMELRVTDPQPLGTWIRGGTRPHVIVPVRAQVLHFVTEAGVEVFTRKVHHPGTKPNPYHERTMKRMKPEIDQELAKLGKKFVKELAG